MKKIKKAVIPVAGYGLNFLPATKATPKELMPIVDKPVIQFIVEEAVAAGIEEILIITGRHKRSVEDHFDSNVELEANLAEKGKQALLEIAQATTMTNLFFTRQAYPLGLGDAIRHAEAFVGDEPFAIMLGDNIIDSQVPALKQLIDLYEETGQANLAVERVEQAKLGRYGVVEVGEGSGRVHSVQSLVEKPGEAAAPSDLAIAGRYIVPGELFEILRTQQATVDGEIQLTDALNRLLGEVPMQALELEGTRHDVGDVAGYIEYSIQYGLQHPDTAADLRRYLIDLSQALQAGAVE